MILNNGVVVVTPDQPSELQRLKASHLAMVELALSGMTRNDIAKSLDRSPEGVGLIMASGKFQEELARRRRELNKATDQATAVQHATVADLFKENVSKAKQSIVDCMSSSNERIKLDSAMGIIDRVYGKNAPTSPLTNVTVINTDKINILLQVLQEDRDLELKQVG